MTIGKKKHSLTQNPWVSTNTSLSKHGHVCQSQLPFYCHSDRSFIRGSFSPLTRKEHPLYFPKSPMAVMVLIFIQSVSNSALKQVKCSYYQSDYYLVPKSVRKYFSVIYYNLEGYPKSRYCKSRTLFPGTLKWGNQAVFPENSVHSMSQFQIQLHTE